MIRRHTFGWRLVDADGRTVKWCAAYATAGDAAQAVWTMRHQKRVPAWHRVELFHQASDGRHLAVTAQEQYEKEGR